MIRNTANSRFSRPNVRVPSSVWRQNRPFLWFVSVTSPFFTCFWNVTTLFFARSVSCFGHTMMKFHCRWFHHTRRIPLTGKLITNLIIEIPTQIVGKTRPTFGTFPMQLLIFVIKTHQHIFRVVSDINYASIWFIFHEFDVHIHGGAVFIGTHHTADPLRVTNIAQLDLTRLWTQSYIWRANLSLDPQTQIWHVRSMSGDSNLYLPGKYRSVWSDLDLTRQIQLSKSEINICPANPTVKVLDQYLTRQMTQIIIF